MRCLKKKPEQRKAAVWVVTVKTVYRRRASRLSLTDCRFTAPTELSLLLPLARSTETKNVLAYNRL